MHYSIFFAGALVAQLSQAREHNHGRYHARRDEATVVDWVYVTDVVTVTAGDSPPQDWASHTWQSYSVPSASTSSSSEASASPTSSSSAASSTSLSSPAASASSSASAVSPTTFATSSIAAAPSSYSAPSSSSTSSSAAPSSTGISKTNLTPNGKKAGLSGFPGIQNIAAFGDFAPHISWYSDYTPNTPDSNGVKGIGMLWGGSGSACGSTETSRLDTFNSMISGGTVPDIMFGYYEPDCSCPDSSEMSPSTAASDWNSQLAPLASKGTVLGSPSLCTQYNENFMSPFESAISTSWDVTSIHINKPNVSEAQKDVEYYKKFNKPIWVSEFACVHDNPSWQPCTDQTEIDTFINDVVSYFESESSVVAYGPSNGNGLGNVWPLTDSSGSLTTSGQTYLNAIKSH